MTNHFQGLKDRFAIESSNLPADVKNSLLDEKPELEWPLHVVKDLDRLEDEYLIKGIQDPSPAFVDTVVKFLEEAESKVQEALDNWRDLSSWMYSNSLPEETKPKQESEAPAFIEGEAGYANAPVGTVVDDGGDTPLTKMENGKWVFVYPTGNLEYSPLFRRKVVRWGKPDKLKGADYEAAPVGTKVSYVLSNHTWEKKGDVWIDSVTGEDHKGLTFPFEGEARKLIQWGEKVNPLRLGF